MPNSDFQQLLQELQNQEVPSPNHRALLEALLAYDVQTANFRQTRRRRKLPLVTAKDKTRLMTLHLTIGKAADNLLQDETASKELRDMVRKITFLSAGHYNALQQYDPAKEAKTLSARDNERQAAADRQRHSQERNPDLIQNQVQPELQIRTN